jgi:3-deoxy-D-manno-octulosonate 8-phosphate phosphatase KdsC-like HAD superfamily phosphatase
MPAFQGQQDRIEKIEVMAVFQGSKRREIQRQDIVEDQQIGELEAWRIGWPVMFLAQLGH